MSLFERKRDREPDPYAPPKIRDLGEEAVVMSDGTRVPPRLVRQDGLPRASSLPAALDDTAQDLDALRDALQKDAPAGNLPAVYVEPKPPERTDLEHIALWFKFLPYDGYDEFAVGAVGVVGAEKADEFMKKLNAWQKKVNEERARKLAALTTEEDAP